VGLSREDCDGYDGTSLLTFWDVVVFPRMLLYTVISYSLFSGRLGITTRQ
jgi:hypothetical protein